MQFEVVLPTGQINKNNKLKIKYYEITSRNEGFD